MAEVKDETLDHDYDGIQEYDNPLPRWWVWLFVGCIVYAITYIPYYHFGPGELPEQQYARAMDEWNELHPPTPLPAEEELESMENEQVIASGKAIFATRCAACHAPDGGGTVGPNLTDEYTLHGYSREQIVKVIHDGVPTKGMIPWADQLSRDEIYAVGLFVYNLRGTTPSNPKAPQGEPIRGEGDGGLASR